MKGWVKSKAELSVSVTMALLTAALLFAGGCAPDEDATVTEPTRKVGLIAPLTGQAAQFGEWARDGLLVAQEELRAAGDLPVPEVLVQDSQNQAAQAVGIFNRFASTDRVDAVLVVTSGDTLAVAPLATQHELVTITATIMPEVTQHSPYLFRNSTSLELEVEAMVRHLAKRSPKPRVAILYISIDAGEWAKSAFTEQYEAAGGEVVGTESYSPGSTDFRPQLASLKNEQPDILYLLSYSEYGNAMKQARELGLTAQFAGITTIEDPKGLALAGDAADGTIYTRAAFDPTVQEGAVRDFVSRYEELTGAEPEIFAATFRDNLHILARAFKTTSNDGLALRETLLDLPPFRGVTGTTTFMENRDVEKPVELRKVDGERFVPLNSE